MDFIFVDPGMRLTAGGPLAVWQFRKQGVPPSLRLRQASLAAIALVTAESFLEISSLSERTETILTNSPQ